MFCLLVGCRGDFHQKLNPVATACSDAALCSGASWRFSSVGIVVFLLRSPQAAALIAASLSPG